MIAFWIFLSLSVSHFTLAAPVAAGEIVEVRSDPVQFFKDGMAATREKRMSPNNKDQSSTNDVQLPGAQGAKGQEATGWRWPWESNELGSNDVRLPVGGASGVNTGGVQEKGEPGWRWPWESGSNSKGPDGSKSPNNLPNNPPNEKSAGGSGGGVSTENVSPAPKSEHPSNPIKAIFDKWIEGGGRGGPRIFY